MPARPGSLRLISVSFSATSERTLNPPAFAPLFWGKSDSLGQAPFLVQEFAPFRPTAPRSGSQKFDQDQSLCEIFGENSDFLVRTKQDAKRPNLDGNARAGNSRP
jgi:hypothetical protein